MKGEDHNHMEAVHKAAVEGEHLVREGEMIMSLSKGVAYDWNQSAYHHESSDIP